MLAALSAPAAPIEFDRDPVVFNTNGGWCWFQDERALIDGDRLIMGSISSVPERRGERSGDVDVTAYDLKTGESSVVTLNPRFEQDDHSAPAFLVRPDGRLLVVYADHSRDPSIYIHKTVASGDPLAWTGVDRRRFERFEGHGICYSNVYRLEAEGRTYNFHRGYNFDPNWMYSDDDGDTWHYGGHFIRGGDGRQRPYLRYTSNGRDEIHFIATEGHPRDVVNSVYHGFVRDGRVYRTDGSPVSDLHEGEDTGLVPDQLTQIFAGDGDNIAWTVDVELDGDGHPYALFSVNKDRIRPGEGGRDHRYHYARWDGDRWHVHEIAHAGTRLYAGEDDYTGLGALDTGDPNVVYISTDADPVSGEPLVSAADGERRYEIFRGTTGDLGGSWDWTPVTEGSTADNIRPIFVSGGGEAALLWLRGEYRSYVDYDTEVVGLVSRDPDSSAVP